MPFPTRAEEMRRRRELSFLASLASHGAVALALWAIPKAPPPAPILELELVQRGDPEKPPGPPPAPDRNQEHQEAAAEPSKPRPRPRPRSTAPPVAAIADVAPADETGPPTPSPTPQPGPPTSFRDWQRTRTSRWMPSGKPDGTGGGMPDGNGQADVRGRDRCEPPPGRTFGILYLMFDSSGSMSDIRRAQALSCAHQYASAALALGSAVVVGNFARDTVFTGPTRSMFDIEAALRGITDGSATRLPSKELQPFVDREPDVDSELVILSDGMFPTNQDVLVWYRYYLELNPENRGTMYTVGTPGYRPAVRDLRAIGFDVFMYEQIRRPDGSL